MLARSRTVPRFLGRRRCSLRSRESLPAALVFSLRSRVFSLRSYSRSSLRSSAQLTKLANQPRPHRSRRPLPIHHPSPPIDPKPSLLPTPREFLISTLGLLNLPLHPFILLEPMLYRALEGLEPGIKVDDAGACAGHQYQSSKEGKRNHTVCGLCGFLNCRHGADGTTNSPERKPARFSRIYRPKP